MNRAVIKTDSEITPPGTIHSASSTVVGPGVIDRGRNRRFLFGKNKTLFKNPGILSIEKKKEKKKGDTKRRKEILEREQRHRNESGRDKDGFEDYTSGHYPFSIQAPSSVLE
ncbi:hypothetical protein CEXT_768721 [Caerostris extrusa]|uniref:Ycf1 n=1 Tax=Caerostris extrusa TaxID=172846 RepID=A0AAV4Q1S3_CAEEX|nr:hypothetical protein CEXT_768721 [Caerostris extrusa]